MRIGSCVNFAFLDQLRFLNRVVHADEAFDENAGSNDVLGVNPAHLHDLLRLHDGCGRRHAHDRGEIAGRFIVKKISETIGPRRLDQREVRRQAPFQDIIAAIELPHFLALGQRCADRGHGEKGRNARAAGADALGQRPLRDQFQLNLAFAIESGKTVELAVRGNEQIILRTWRLAISAANPTRPLPVLLLMTVKLRASWSINA